MVLPSSHVKADDLVEICTDTFIGSKAQELQELLQNKVALEVVAGGGGQQGDASSQPQSFRMMETKTRCRGKVSRFRDSLQGLNLEAVRIFALASPKGFQRLTGSPADAPQVVKVDLIVGTAPR